MSAILKAIATFILDWLWRKGASLLLAWWNERQANKKSQEENKEAREKLEKAETKEERRDAADTIRDNW